MLARKAGLTIGELGGVLCDSRLRTSAEGIYAAGDMCEYDSVVHGRADAHRARGGRRRPGRHRRAQHARRRRRRTTRSPTSSPTSPTGRRWSTSARRSSWDDEQVEGSVDDGEFAIWYREGGPRARDAQRRRRRRPRPRARAHPGLSAARARPAISATVPRSAGCRAGSSGRTPGRRRAPPHGRTARRPSRDRRPGARSTPAASRMPGVARAIPAPPAGSDDGPRPRRVRAPDSARASARRRAAQRAARARRVRGPRAFAYRRSLASASAHTRIRRLIAARPRSARGRDAIEVA